MTKIIDSDSNQIDVRLFLEEMTPAQTESLLGGCYQYLQPYPYTYTGNNNLTKPPMSMDNKSSNQKINSIDNSKKTYINGVIVPKAGNTLVI